MKISTLIIGQGLAGSLSAYFFGKANASFLVIDAANKNSASRIGAGMFTPIGGKRMSKSPLVESYIPFAIETYREMEDLLGLPLLHQEQIYFVLGSVKEQNDLSGRMDVAEFAKYIDLKPVKELNINEPFGAFEVNSSGWLNSGLFIEKYRELLSSKDCLREEFFDYLQLKWIENEWHYKDIIADTVIFCEGYRVNDNPFFSHLDIDPCKGDILDVSCPGGPENRIMKKGCYMVHTGKGKYKVGSTYLWENIDDEPREEEKQILIDKLKDLITLPFSVDAHQSGIRATTKDRRPVIAMHPTEQNMYALNGLGAKGVMFAPWWARELVSQVVSAKL